MAIGLCKLQKLSALSAFRTQEITKPLEFDVVCTMFNSGCERRIVCAKVVKIELRVRVRVSCHSVISITIGG